MVPFGCLPGASSSIAANEKTCSVNANGKADGLCIRFGSQVSSLALLRGLLSFLHTLCSSSTMLTIYGVGLRSLMDCLEHTYELNMFNPHLPAPRQLLHCGQC